MADRSDASVLREMADGEDAEGINRVTDAERTVLIRVADWLDMPDAPLSNLEHPDAAKVERGDVVQIDMSLGPTFAHCFATVSSVRSWGVTAYVLVPGRDGLAYIRLSFGEFERIGKAAWTSPHDPEDSED